MPLVGTKRYWSLAARRLWYSAWLVLFSLPFGQAQTVVTKAQQQRIEDLYQRFQ